MKTVVVSAGTYEMIARASRESGYVFRSTGRARPDGQWEFQIDDDTFQRLRSLQVVGESIDGVIQRLLFATTKVDGAHRKLN